MKYINTKTGQWPINEGQFAQFNRADLAPIVEVAAPWYDSTTQRLIEGNPVQVQGEWRMVWRIVALTEDELAAAQAQQRAQMPQVVSRFQARAALMGAGLLDAVQFLMDNPATPAIARLAWSEAIEFRRDSPTVAGLSALLGLDEAALDALFIAAAAIQA